MLSGLYRYRPKHGAKRLIINFLEEKMARKNLETERKKRNLWMLENVDELTKKIIKMHAIEHDTTIATALKQLVEAGKSALNQTK